MWLRGSELTKRMQVRGSEMRDHFVDELLGGVAAPLRRNSAEVRDVRLEVQTSAVDRSFGKYAVAPLECSVGDQSLTCVLWVSGGERSLREMSGLDCLQIFIVK